MFELIEVAIDGTVHSGYLISLADILVRADNDEVTNEATAGVEEARMIHTRSMTPDTRGVGCDSSLYINTNPIFVGLEAKAVVLDDVLETENINDWHAIDNQI